jgi:hypothetical protein
MAKAKKITSGEAILDLKKRKHDIDPSDATAIVKKYQSFRTKLIKAKEAGDIIPDKTPELPISVSYNKKAIQLLLKHPESQGIRIYPAIKDGALTFVLVGIDANGENIGGSNLLAKGGSGTGSGTVDEGQQCPPFPGPKTP